MKQKMYYTTLGYLCAGINLCLIETRFNIVGIVFGFVAVGFFIKALRIRRD